MNRDTKLAATAGLVYAGAEVWLGRKYPLAQPMPLPARMAVAGGLAVLSVLLASRLVKRDA